MLRKRISLFMAALFALVLMLSFSSTVFAAPNVSVNASVSPSVGIAGYTVNLNITLTNSSNDFTNSRINLSLPSTVSISSVAGGTLISGTNNITPSGASVSVLLNCNSASSLVYSATYGKQYRADVLTVQYTAWTGGNVGDSSADSRSLDLAVRGNTGYAYDNPNIPVLSSGSSSSSYWNPYYNNYYGSSYYNNYYGGLNPTCGTSYNGIYYYDYRNGIGYNYDPYAQLNNYYGLTFDKSTLSLGTGQSYQLKVTAGMYGSTYGVNYSSSDASVAAVDSNGLVTGLKNGTAVITARSTYGTSITCTVTVGYGNSSVPNSSVTVPTVQQQVSSLTFSKTRTILYVGDMIQMYVNVKPSNVDFNGTQLGTSDPNVIKVYDGGLIEAVGKGKATIYFSFGGRTAQRTFTVK